MVIQRTWKPSGDNLQVPNNNSSDDSNGSNQTISSTNTNSSKGQNNKPMTTTPQMAENILSRLKQRFGTQVIGQKSSSEAVMRSLELLRINIQSAFDKDIDSVMRKFMEAYFKPAFKNIKENLGENSVSDDVLQKMSCALLENSKAQYNTRTRQAVQQTTLVDISIVKPETSTQTTNVLKRLATDLPSPEIVQIVKKPLVHIQQQRVYVQPPRRQIFWNTSNISTETQFLLDVQANQAFGFGTDGKERLASKHPELIRYLPDGQDRDWLVQNRIIPSQNRNSRFLFLVYDEVMKLGHSEDYRCRENLNLQNLISFKIPHFIIQKMKAFFIDLNIKSRGLITNSYSTPSVGSHLRNALLQGSHLSTVTSSTTVSTENVGTTTVKSKSSLSSSHATLTALLTNNNNNNNNNNNSETQHSNDNNSLTG